MSPPYITFPQLNFIIKDKQQPVPLTVQHLTSLRTAYNTVSPDSTFGFSMTYHTGGIILAATSNNNHSRVLRSVDYGNTWVVSQNITGTAAATSAGAIGASSNKQRVSTDPTKMRQPQITNLIYTPQNGTGTADCVYFTTGNENPSYIYKSIDGGLSFAIVYQDNINTRDYYPGGSQYTSGNQKFLLFGSGQTGDLGRLRELEANNQNNLNQPTVNLFNPPASYKRSLHPIFLPDTNFYLLSVSNSHGGSSGYVVWRTNNTGINQTISISGASNQISFLDLGSGNVLAFCSTASNVVSTFFSSDSGATWVARGTIPQNSVWGKLKIGNSIFVLCYDAASTQTQRATIFRSNDGGLTWSQYVRFAESNGVPRALNEITDSSHQIDFLVYGTSRTPAGINFPVLYRVTEG